VRDVDITAGTLCHPRRRAERERPVRLCGQYTDVVRYCVGVYQSPRISAATLLPRHSNYRVVPPGWTLITSPGQYDVINSGRSESCCGIYAQKLGDVTMLWDVDVDAWRLEVGWRHTDIEPQLIGDMRTTSCCVASKLTRRTRKDRLQREPQRITWHAYTVSIVTTAIVLGASDAWDSDSAICDRWSRASVSLSVTRLHCAKTVKLIEVLLGWRLKEHCIRRESRSCHGFLMWPSPNYFGLLLVLLLLVTVLVI